MTTAATTISDEDQLLIENVMRATGLTHEEAVHLLLMDQELDEACDAALSDLSFKFEGDVPPKGSQKRDHSPERD